jgi:hypothetical protein
MTTNPNENSHSHLNLNDDGYSELAKDEESISYHTQRRAVKPHTRSDSHGVSHSELEDLLKTRLNNIVQKHKLSGEESSEEAYENSWSAYSVAKQNVIVQTMNMLARIVHAQLPTAKFIILYEDHSHDAPHGHIESFLDESGHLIDLGEDWHDIPWGSEVDELVWDIYNLAKEHFTTSGDKRRFVVEV